VNNIGRLIRIELVDRFSIAKENDIPCCTLQNHQDGRKYDFVTLQNHQDGRKYGFVTLQNRQDGRKYGFVTLQNL